MSQDPEFGIILMLFTWFWEAFICRKCRFYFSGWCCLLIVYIHVSREGCPKTPVNGKILSHMQLQHTHPHLHCYTQHTTAQHSTAQHNTSHHITSHHSTHRSDAHTDASIQNHTHGHKLFHTHMQKTVYICVCLKHLHNHTHRHTPKPT